MMKLINKYIEYLRYEKNYSSHTEISYFTDLSQFAAYLEQKHPEVELKTVDSDVVRLWIVALMSEKNSARTVNRKLSAVKSFYGYLLRFNLVKSNPATKVVGPKVRKPIPVFVKDADMNTLLGELADDATFEQFRNYLILELFYVTGIRRAELIGLKDVDVDFYAKTIKVLGKRNKERLIPISDDICDKFSRYINLRDNEIATRVASLFVKEDGESLYPVLVHRIITQQLESISTLSKTSPHVLRHSFATSMLNNGADINAVKEILGHSSLAATEVYTHTSFEELRNIYNKAHPRA